MFLLLIFPTRVATEHPGRAWDVRVKVAVETAAAAVPAAVVEASSTAGVTPSLPAEEEAARVDVTRAIESVVDATGCPPDNVVK